MSKSTYQLTLNGCLTLAPPVLSRASGFRILTVSVPRNNFLLLCRILQHLIKLQRCLILLLGGTPFLLEWDSPTLIAIAQTYPSLPSISCSKKDSLQKHLFTLSSFTKATSLTAIVGPFSLVVLFRWCSQRLSW